MLQDVVEIGLIHKMDVADVEASEKWYEGRLGFVPDHRFDSPGWRQLNVPGVRGAAVGLNQHAQHVGGGTVLTLAVSDIEAAREELIREGVSVTPVERTEHDVALAFFKDPDGNQLGLRQDPAGGPAQLGTPAP